MPSRIHADKFTNAIRKTAEGKALVRMGIAAFRPRLTGGFAEEVEKRQGEWADLSPSYARRKAGAGKGKRKPRKPAPEGTKQRQKQPKAPLAPQDPRKWVRTGRTLKALTDNVPTGEGTKKFLRFKINSNKRATIRTTIFGPPEGKRPPDAVQKRILGYLNFGSKKRPGRQLFAWRAIDVDRVRGSLEKELAAMMGEKGLEARRK